MLGNNTSLSLVWIISKGQFECSLPYLVNQSWNDMVYFTWDVRKMNAAKKFTVAQKDVCGTDIYALVANKVKLIPAFSTPKLTVECYLERCLNF